MQFAKGLREGVRSGAITCSVRVWQNARVKVGGSYRLGEGRVVVDSVREIVAAEVTEGLARESGFASVADLMATARHGSGDTVYLVRFHYVGS